MNGRSTSSTARPDSSAGGAIVEKTEARLTALLELRACWFEAFPFDEQMPRIEDGHIVLPAVEPGIAPWSLDRGVELPVRYSGLTIGRFVLIPAAPTTGVDFPPARRSEAISMAGRVGAVIAARL